MCSNRNEILTKPFEIKTIVITETAEYRFDFQVVENLLTHRISAISGETCSYTFAMK